MIDGNVAQTLAAHGYPVLQLAYFGEPGLPPALRRIPLEYFERALEWMRRQPEVDPGRILTFGWSRGGEASLLVASTFPKLVHGAVGYVPSEWVQGAPGDPAIPAWTYKGRPVPWYRSPADRARSLIPIWKSSGPVFVVGGLDDRLWPSGFYAQEVGKQMRLHGRHDVTALAYKGAGHLLYQAIPPQITTSAVGYGSHSTNYGQANDGGSPKADEAALEASWPRLLRFLATL